MTRPPSSRDEVTAIGAANARAQPRPEAQFGNTSFQPTDAASTMADLARALFSGDPERNRRRPARATLIHRPRRDRAAAPLIAGNDFHKEQGALAGRPSTPQKESPHHGFPPQYSTKNKPRRRN